jgi:hypothetical protein
MDMVIYLGKYLFKNRKFKHRIAAMASWALECADAPSFWKSETRLALFKAATRRRTPKGTTKCISRSRSSASP